MILNVVGFFSFNFSNYGPRQFRINNISKRFADGKFKV